MALVLVVDDEEELADMISMVVEDLGHDCLTATNGRDALMLLEGQSALPALVISDVMMPHMNGVDFARRLKQSAEYCGIPIILMSAAGAPVAGSDADMFIHKPFELDSLISVIERFIA